jgi:hypothetical protein
MATTMPDVHTLYPSRGLKDNRAAIYGIVGGLMGLCIVTTIFCCVVSRDRKAIQGIVMQGVNGGPEPDDHRRPRNRMVRYERRPRRERPAAAAAAAPEPAAAEGGGDAAAA